MEARAENLIRTEYSEVMQKAYIDYAMSVIIARALPDVRDGLKPVQRRTLYDMHELGIRYDRPYRKCARIVGDTMGKYHPHGDSSIYESLVVMAQDFKKGLPLVDGHGNFGSIEGDGAAAMRYTDARLQKITQEAYLADLDKDVVDFVPNFDETEKEPEVLPVKVPNILINGAEGIAVGMATSIPPHNFGEVIDGVKAYMKNPDINTEQMMEYIKGPDFPTGGIVTNKDDLLSIYSTGSGKIKVRGKVEIEKMKGGKERIVITEIPYTMIGANIGKFLNDVYSLVETKKTNDIVDISNQSSKEGIRIVIELKRGADAENICNLLYKKTKLEDTFSVNMLAVADGRPETMGIVPMIRHHVNFQYEIATRKYKTLLAKELEKKEVQEGLIKACDVIDLIIEILRGSKNIKDAKACLVHGKTDAIKFKSEESKQLAAQLQFTEKQATAILEMRLYKLIGLEIEALLKEHDKTLKNIATYENILGSRTAMAKVIIKELDAFKKEYAKERKTVIDNVEAAVVEEKKIEEMDEKQSDEILVTAEKANSILVIEDDSSIQELIVEFLSSQGYNVDFASDGLEGISKFKQGNYDLIILDIMMPNLDGYSVCKMIRKNSTVPIIFLSALNEEENQVKGFELECDDYITKPFSFNLLIKRVEAVLRRSTKSNSEELLQFEDLNLNLNTYTVEVDGETIELTLKEFNILKTLIEKYPQVITRENLLDSIWGYDYYGDTRIVDAHIKNLRKKIKLQYIKTVKGIGYTLEKSI